MSVTVLATCTYVHTCAYVRTCTYVYVANVVQCVNLNNITDYCVSQRNFHEGTKQCHWNTPYICMQVRTYIKYTKPIQYCCLPHLPTSDLPLSHAAPIVGQNLFHLVWWHTHKPKAQSTLRLVPCTDQLHCWFSRFWKPKEVQDLLCCCWVGQVTCMWVCMCACIHNSFMPGNHCNHAHSPKYILLWTDILCKITWKCVRAPKAVIFNLSSTSCIVLADEHIR